MPRSRRATRHLDRAFPVDGRRDRQIGVLVRGHELEKVAADRLGRLPAIRRPIADAGKPPGPGPYLQGLSALGAGGADMYK